MKTTPFAVLIFVIIAAGCAGGETTQETTDSTTPSSAVVASDGTPSIQDGVRLVSAEQAAEIQNDPPDGLIVLDVRTPDEFAEGHLEGAILIDFYEPDFADQLAELDPDQPYLLYCRSGNRSGQTAVIMEELGFTNVADVDGGIVAWNGAGLPTEG